METKVKIKKKCHFFEIYITKQLKEISEKKITNDAKCQLNSVLYSISKIISDVAFNLTIISKKKTISLKEFRNSINIVFPKELSNEIIDKYNLILQNFSTSNNIYSNRNVKAGIIFPPSVLEKFLRGFGYRKIMVTNDAPVALATVIEYISYIFLNLSSVGVLDRKKITSEDLDEVVENNVFLKKVFIKYNIYFMNSKKLKPFTYSYSKENKCIRKEYIVRNKSKIINNILPRFSFERIIRNIVKEKSDIEIKISKETFIVLQYYLENYILNLLHDSYFAAIHAKRIKLLPADINFINSIRNNDIKMYMKIIDVTETEKAELVFIE
jgi:histone H3/H4